MLGPKTPCSYRTPLSPKYVLYSYLEPLGGEGIRFWAQGLRVLSRFFELEVFQTSGH